MSGLELVGLALAIIPLIMGAADGYRSLLEPVVTALRPKAQAAKLKDFYRDFLYEVTMLQTHITRALDPSAKSRSTRSDSVLLDDFERHIQEDRLGDGHGAFIDILRDNMELFNHLVSEKELGLRDTPLMDQSSMIYARLQALKREKDRGIDITKLRSKIHFSLKGHRRQTLLRKLRENNVRLEKLFKMRIIGIAVVNASHVQHSKPPSAKSREVLGRLYDAIAHRWHEDPCSDGHQAMMSLKCCYSWSDVTNNVNTEMHIVMSVHSSSRSLWQESKLSIVEMQESHRMQVTFADDNSRSPQAPVNQPQLRRPFANICNIIQNSQKNNAHLCVEYDGHELWHVKPTAPVPSIVHAMTPRMTLNELLDQQHRISRKQKHILAVILAKGLLHFGESQWLNREWTKRHVSFLREATGQKTDLSRPYLFTNFNPTINGSSEDTDRMYSMHRNSSVLSLGILLLEIEIWDMIENRHRSDDLTDGTTMNANTNLTTAIRVLGEEGDDLCENYKRAVNACLRCDFAPEAEASLDDETFRKGFHDQILVPLETELFIGWPETISKL